MEQSTGKRSGAEKTLRTHRRALSGGVDIEDSRRVLIVDNSRLSAHLLGRAILETTDRQTTAVHTLAAARQLLKTAAREYLVAVVGLELSDASGTEVVELTLAYGVPTIVLTSSWDSEIRQQIWEYDVFDYYLKAEDGLRAVCEAIQRIPRNPQMKVLVVDDSIVYRQLEAGLLRTHGFQVFTARDGLEALERLEEHPDLSLVVTDYEMPRLDGISLVTRIRADHPREELAIVGVSSLGSMETSVGFLKNGANDFLPKPFEKEEFYCRVYNCIDTVERIRLIQLSAFTDSLTGLRNRMHFFVHAPQEFESCKRAEADLVIAMLDIDFFKKVNDTYGHAGGDVVLREVASLARKHLHLRGLLARYGGEEFCFLGVGISREVALEIFEALRAEIEATVVSHEGRDIRVTVSMGVTTSSGEDLDHTLNRADELLYEAKETGRNRVVFD